MFVYYHGTKADFEKKNLSEVYLNDIVFIKGGITGKGECIFTRGNFFGNFEELVNTLKYFKGVAYKVTDESETGYHWSYLDAASGGNYLAFSTKTPKYLEVSAGSTGIEISLTNEFINNISTIEKDLGDLGEKVIELENKLNPDFEGNIVSYIYNLIVGNASEDYNTLEKLEGKVKSLLSKINPGDAIDIITDTENDTITVNVLVDNSSIEVNNENKLSVKTVDGGSY